LRNFFRRQKTVFAEKACHRAPETEAKTCAAYKNERGNLGLFAGPRSCGDVNIYLAGKGAVEITAEQRNAIYYLKNKPAPKD
jgi:hypothetical protein